MVHALHLLAALIVDYGHLEFFVFVSPDGGLIGMATPRAVMTRLGASDPEVGGVVPAGEARRGQ